MSQPVAKPDWIAATKNTLKALEGCVGRLNSEEARVSTAWVVSPQGWIEPGHTSRVDEYTVVLAGALHVKRREEAVTVVNAGQAIQTQAGEWVQYSSPEPGGAVYITACLPAASPAT